MEKSDMKTLAALLACLALSFGCIFLAALVQGDFGNVSVSRVRIPAAGGEVAAKLYLPKGAGPASPAPAVLVMHGYQNDKETSAAYALELARRGVAALSIDEFGHGGTSVGMKGRGYARFKHPDYEKELSGPDRFKLMMSFSRMEFLKPPLSDGILDSSMGGKAALAYLRSLDFVDGNAVGITGHSMGTWASWSAASGFPEHRAVVLQCGELIPRDWYDSKAIRFNNVLLLQAKYDEFSYFRDNRPTVEGLEKTPLRYRDFAGREAPIEWNTTYGSFEDGSARRMELLNTNHRLTTHYGPAVAAAMEWFTRALGVRTRLAPDNLTYLWKEFLVLGAMLAALASMFPLLALLSRTAFFRGVVQPVPSRPETRLSAPAWRKTALTAILLSGATFPFLTQLGHGLMPFPESVFRMTVGDGFITWLSFLMLVSLLLLVRWYRKGAGRRAGVNLHDLGLASLERPSSVDSGVLWKSVLLAFLLCAFVYLQTAAYDRLFLLDFRFIWPFFRPFTLERFGQFWVYLPFYFAFFFVNGGVKLFGQLRQAELPSPAKTQLVWWLRSCAVMLGGLLLVVLIEYVPFFLGFGPGADLFFGQLFGGPFMSILILAIPQFAMVFFLAVYMFRKTGYVYVGSTVMAILASWMLAGGSAIF